MAVYCPRCSTANREGSRFCNNCGETLGTPPPEIPIVTAPTPITEDDSGDTSAAMDESDVISLDQVPATPTISRTSAALAASALISAEAPPAAPVLPEIETPSPVQPEAAGASAPPDAPPLPASDLSAPTAADIAPLPGALPAAHMTESVAPPPAREPLEPASEDVSPIAALRSTRVHVPRLLARVRPPASPRTPLPPAPTAAPDRSNLWRRLAYLALAAAIIVGVLLPPGTLGSATVIAPEVSDMYDTIQSLPLRSTVLLSFDYEPATSDEMQPLATAVITHLMQRQARILTMSLLPQGPALADNVMRTLAEQHIYAYGADYVNLGFFSGDEAALAALGSNLSKALSGDDAAGRPLAGMALPRSVNSLSAINLVIEITDSENGAPRWVEQVQTRTNVRLAALTSAVAMPLAFPYRQSGQLTGLASGLPAAAQYETLLGYTGQATRGMDAQTLGHLMILLFVVLGNIGLLFARRKPAG